MLRKLAPIAAAFLSWALSTYVHYPNLPGSVYSDVASFWYREGLLAAGRMPCFDYFFEYPPATCFMTYAARLLGGPSLEGYYMAFALMSLPAFLVLGWYTGRVAGLPAVALVLAPTMVLYGVYNYDHFHAALMALALALYASGRRGFPYILLGLAASVKLFSMLLLPVLLMDGYRLRYVLLFVVGAAVFTLPVMVVRPEYLASFVNYHASWGLENSWTIWLVGNPYSPSAKVIGWLVAFSLIARALSWSGDSGVEGRSFLMLAGLLLGSPTFTPQMVVNLLPLIASIQSTWMLLPLLEVSNAGIILTWFMVDNPVHPWTLPQTMALGRAACLAIMWLMVYNRLDFPRYLRTGSPALRRRRPELEVTKHS